jgi:hypothetical protein
MSAESMGGEELVAERLASLLSGMGVRATAQGNVVKPGKGTPAIIVSHVEFSRPRPVFWLAHADICFSLNPERSETQINDCATGWGESQEQAAGLAADAWVQVTAPPVFSLLHCSLVHGAEWFPNGDTFGLPGWNVFAGPFGLRGDPEEHQRLEDHLRQHPVLPALAQPILSGFQRIYLNYVKLYRGYSGSEWFADGFVNGVRDQALTDRLLELPWPKIARFASATIFGVAYPALPPQTE